MNLKQLVIKPLKVAVLGLSLTTAYAFEARVVGVSDGDTITFLDANKSQLKIRVSGMQ